ncbi:fumarylacetoacetate hydrolase family protein [Flavihumibacter sp. RY-1]|uniref:Fumarylacetoacetate hydrolase family protein n=1 Tax=Flavihumibacter fluminis TaxID=2909236 RepID=A0ABS9BDL6_9BACT|nr:fumarylacetoacetate hydrolase family protein [Flavihumibacter fluminis]MCF1713690.1 fumarylacetoacetate hydrolase family protein [Flavihumibacter fluminis]
MKLFKTRKGIVVQFETNFFLLKGKDWDAFINRDQLHEQVIMELSNEVPEEMIGGWLNDEILAPIGQQEVWASGVTYLKSREARIEESKDSGGGDFYARVYDAERPELFFKATPARTVGTGEYVHIRRDSKWNVPEPELTLFASASGKIQGYTCGNDMSSRDIEGENPLYLPQAKSYDASAAIGPCLYVPKNPIDPATQIRLEIKRKGAIVFEGSISINRMKRGHEELIGFLFRETSFPNGVFLMTGTGLVPPNEFTLLAGDEVFVSIDSIGTLYNIVAQKG